MDNYIDKPPDATDDNIETNYYRKTNIIDLPIIPLFIGNDCECKCPLCSWISCLWDLISSCC